MKLPARLGAAAAGLMIAGTACFGHGHGGASRDLKAARVTGDVTVQAPGEDARALREGDTIRAGSGVHTGKDSSVRLEGGAGRAIELAGDTQATIVSAGDVSLDVGSALGESGEGTLSFDSRGVGVAVGDGTARLERLLGVLRVGVYSGKTRVDLGGRGVDVPAYRELDFAGGIPVDRVPRPLTLSASDQWDRRLLGDVIEFDQEISQYGTGFNNQFTGQVTAPSFFGGFVGVTNVSFVGGYLGQRPAEILIGLVLAEQVASKTHAAAQRLFPSMLTERSQGATWGLIAKEHGLELHSVLQAVLDAIRRGTAPGSSSGGGGSGGGGQSPGPSPGPTGSPKPKPTGSPSPGPSPSPTPTPTCPPLDRLLGLCPSSGASSGGGTSSAPEDCSLVGVLLDPDC
jgi:hypothetical protein